MSRSLSSILVSPVVLAAAAILVASAAPSAGTALATPHEIPLDLMADGFTTEFDSGLRGDISVPENSGGPGDRLDVSLLDDPAWTSRDPSETMAVVVHVEGPTALELYLESQFQLGDSSPEATRVRDAFFDQVAAGQAPIREHVEASGAVVISAYDAVTNGLLVRATRAQIESIAQADGMRAIYRAPFHYPQLNRAVQIIGADRVIEALGYNGSGVNIAIIDTGIDYTHAAFGGTGNAADYGRNNPNIIETGTFPSDKVIGGFDFAGTRYTGGNVPAPDSDPLDEAGHGTHVAGIAAGKKGSTVPHGVAPEARLIALKVFGANGGTNLANDAVEWCVEANLGRRPAGLPARCDVINMSLGSGWSNGVSEALGIAKSATDAGVTIIASAGNSGDVAYITGSPAAAPHTISVASTFAGGQRSDKIQVDHYGRTEDVEAAEADPRFAPQMAEIGSLEAPLIWFGRACTGDVSAGDPTDAIALIAYGGCTAKEVIDRAQAEGALGAILFNFREELFTIGADADEGDFGATVELPAYAIRLSDGERLRDQLTDGTSATARFEEAFKDSLSADSLGDVISPFSSRGPSRRGEMKPEVSAPGSNIVAPAMGSGGQSVSLSGTSMAAPMVAGAAALIIHRLRIDGIVPDAMPLQPALSPYDIGALDVGAMLINYTATVWEGSNRSGVPVPFARGGSGRIDALAAARAGTIVRAGVIATINFGRSAFATETKDFVESYTIRNISDEAKRYATSVEFLFANDRDAGVTHSMTLDEVTVPAHTDQTVTLNTKATAKDMKPFGAYGGGNVMNRLGGLNDAEFDAHVVVTELGPDGEPLPGGDVARVPIYLLPRATSTIRASENPALLSPGTGSGPITFENSSQADGVAELFALIGEDTDTTPVPGPKLDIQNVGARVARDERGRRVVEIAIQTMQRRDLPIESSFRVYLDTDRDGGYDELLFNHDLFFFLSGGRTAEGAQRMLRMEVTRSSPLTIQNTVFSFPAFPYAEFAEVTLDSRQIILRAYAEVLGYGPTDPIAFSAVVMHVPVFPEVIGSVRNARYDVVPNGGYVEAEDGTISLTTENLKFDERRLAFELDRWTVPVAGEDSNFAVGSRRSVEGAGPVHDRIMAVYTRDLPSVDDIEIITLEEGEVLVPPTHTASPEPTSTRPFPTVRPIGTPVPGGDSTIYMPAAYRSFPPS